jgi:hypothetical protein
MERAVVVRGRLHGRQIDLDEPVEAPEGEVEVVVRAVPAVGATRVQDVFEFLRSLPPGQRRKDDIDRQVAEERDAWGER